MNAEPIENRDEVPKNKLLYDTATLRHYADEYGRATNIKQHVKTTATVLEIDTALRYWNGRGRNWRTAEKVIQHCEEIEAGNWKLNDDNKLVYAE